VTKAWRANIARKIKHLPPHSKWNVHADPLLRGDQENVAVPTPKANSSIVRHILYLGGMGRESPYLSATESEAVARYFAGSSGKVWKTQVASVKKASVKHIDNNELLGLLRGKGFGPAKWSSALEVKQARKYVEQWLEHLLDFRPLSKIAKQELEAAIQNLFEAF
jgi:hypothetical protein